jgi:hypothetical protein
MKMNFAGLQPSPNVKPENFRFNCTRNKACQMEFFIPINNICDFMLYFDLPFLPASYTIEIVDSCTGNVQAANVINYVAASHTAGFYAIFAGLTSGTLPPLFFIQVSFFSSSNVEAVFYSNDFEIVTCEQLTKISSCYNDAAPGTEAFDSNDVYYGQPLGTILGNENVRYYHFLKVRKGSVLNNKTKLSLSAFNYNKVYKGQAAQQYNFFSESVPEFYKEEILAVIARGNILINEKPYQVADEVELSIVDEDSQRWAMNVALTKLLFSYFSCKQTVCLADPCQPILPPPPPEPCCDPTIISSAVHVIIPTPSVCRSYQIDVEQISTATWNNCETGVQEQQVLQIGDSITVCSRTVPVTDHPSSIITDLGDCNTVECFDYYNNTSDTLTGISYTACNGDIMTNQTVFPGQSICIQSGTGSGANFGYLINIGVC